MDIQSVGIVVAVVIACVAVAVVGFKLSERREDRKREAVKDAQRLRDEGYPFIPDFLECYGFSDLTGMVASAVKAVRAVHDPIEKFRARDSFLRRQLELACQDSERLKKVAEIVAQYAPAVAAINAAVAVTLPVAAPVAAAAAAAAEAAAEVSK